MAEETTETPEESVEDLAGDDKDTLDDLNRLKDEDEGEEGEKEEKETKEEKKTSKKTEKESTTEEKDSSVEGAIEDALKEDEAEEAEEEEGSIEFSEDSVLSDGVRKALTELDKKADIDDEVLEEVGDILEKATQDGYDHVIEQFKEEHKARRKEMMANPLLNEENKEKTSKNIQAAIKKFGGDSQENLSKFFNSHHSYSSALVTFLNNIGSALNEQPELGGASTTAKGKESPEDAALAQAKKENAILFE